LHLFLRRFAFETGHGSLAVEAARLFGRSTPLAQFKDAQNPDAGVKDEGQNIARLYTMAGLQRLLAVEADMAGFDQFCRSLPGPDHAGDPEPFVEALASRAVPIFRQAWP